jgi:hypothetical protein
MITIIDLGPTYTERTLTVKVYDAAGALAQTITEGITETAMPGAYRLDLTPAADGHVEVFTELSAVVPVAVAEVGLRPDDLRGGTVGVYGVHGPRNG